MKNPKIIVALDCADQAQALLLVRNFSPKLCRLKVGLELFTAAGPGVIGKLTDLGYDVFLDLKFHDIPNTVARACKAAANLGVWMLNVHTLGSEKMLVAAREAVDKCTNKPILLGVTVLTSHNAHELETVGLMGEPETTVTRLAALAQKYGLDGIVCSPKEAAGMRKSFGPDFVLVTPGVRPEGSKTDDQQRFMTPVDAIRQGSDYLVIGRPITGSPDPKASLEAICEELNQLPS